MSMQHFGKKWTYGFYKAGNGSKTFGAQLWYNSQRIAVQVDVGLWQVYLMREWR